MGFFLLPPLAQGKLQKKKFPVGIRSTDSVESNKIVSRGQSPCPSVCSGGNRSSSASSTDERSHNSDSTIKRSDDEESDFQIVKNKNKRVARRLQKSEEGEIGELYRLVDHHQNNDFRKLNSYLIKNNIPFHTYVIEEEREVIAVIKGISVKIETKDIKTDLKRQEYPVQAVHRMHR
ncbi:hypothetical protein EVAR_87609_1 [Eumeta japonica]|uniref:Uncharacterized protein n=1 Tax=Eumeta variegata TaxID=151549 RepID=A0A4C1WMH0_EUMVA|nr:hypothetical protein EVAR_87609_1 [Eumeta japonica]